MMTKKQLQMIYGAIIVCIGVLVIYRVPEVMVKVEDAKSFAGSLLWIRICFYILGGLLVFAGILKLHKNYK